MLRSLKTSKAKALIVAHNIEHIEAADGTDEMIGQILQLCTYKLEWVYDDAIKAAAQQLVERENPVPVVFAFTRRSLSRALKRSAKTSCVAVLSHDGASDLFHEVIKKAAAARRQWSELTAPYPADRGAPRRLILRQLRGENKQVPLDQLLLHAMTVDVDTEER